ncbi:helix-turn-helix transcriptional regulator [Chloroflexus sp.]|uniref:helix-turn-helix domain-containing protein n=1 Tax=Chloroflexus sp. TaxID=1904827 RepID=UPI002ACE0085|nr:helix-turn-helix transcriptional regulator [Chloroflexus sp.]
MMHKPLDTLVARRLREARIAAGLTVREAAAAAGIPDHSLLVRYENRVARPPLERLHALAMAYDTTLAALLTERDEAVKLIAAIERADTPTLNRLLAALN